MGSSPKGCGNKGHCATGSCNKLNTYDWLSAIVLPVDYSQDDQLVEVSFKNGSRKEFAYNPQHVRAVTGDWVAIDTGNGYDLGQVSLSGELVDIQMKRKKVKRNASLYRIIRIANERDMEKLQEAREMEKNTMIHARIIARKLKLEMKIGDVEYQGDKRKATFYYIADGRVDFRELIKEYAREFRVKIEMRQIGARQESSRIGGLGSCGRELCCSTWLTDFKSVSTSAAKYQNLALNQTKLSGQCGRLKCCLNYELETYMDALKQFPRKADYLDTESGRAALVKTDIFKRVMYYIYKDKRNSKIVPMSVDDVKSVLAMNKDGRKPADLEQFVKTVEVVATDKPIEFTSDHDALPSEERRRTRQEKQGRDRSGRRRGRRDGDKRQQSKDRARPKDAGDENKNKPSGNKPADPKSRQSEQGGTSRRPSRNKRKKRKPGGDQAQE